MRSWTTTAIIAAAQAGLALGAVGCGGAPEPQIIGPDPCIAGTETVFIDVPTEIDLSESFKVTGALAVRSPGGAGIEVVTDAEPTFVWEDDSSEEGYELRVYDAFGELVHEDLDIPDGRGSDVTYTWSGASLTPGMIYQFRAWSWRRTERCLISSTEDLRGVFVYEGP